jgi:hypothetical protein
LIEYGHHEPGHGLKHRIRRVPPHHAHLIHALPRIVPRVHRDIGVPPPLLGEGEDARVVVPRPLGLHWMPELQVVDEVVGVVQVRWGEGVHRDKQRGVCGNVCKVGDG